MTDTIIAMLAITAKDWNLPSPAQGFQWQRFSFYKRTTQWQAVTGGLLSFTPKRSSLRTRSLTAFHSTRKLGGNEAASAASLFAPDGANARE